MKYWLKLSQLNYDDFMDTTEKIVYLDVKK